MCTTLQDKLQVLGFELNARIVKFVVRNSSIRGEKMISGYPNKS